MFHSFIPEIAKSKDQWLSSNATFWNSTTFSATNIDVVDGLGVPWFYTSKYDDVRQRPAFIFEV